MCSFSKAACVISAAAVWEEVQGGHRQRTRSLSVLLEATTAKARWRCALIRPRHMPRDRAQTTPPNLTAPTEAALRRHGVICECCQRLITASALRDRPARMMLRRSTPSSICDFVRVDSTKDQFRCRMLRSSAIPVQQISPTSSDETRAPRALAHHRIKNVQRIARSPAANGDFVG